MYGSDNGLFNCRAIYINSFEETINTCMVMTVAVSNKRDKGGLRKKKVGITSGKVYTNRYNKSVIEASISIFHDMIYKGGHI